MMINFSIIVSLNEVIVLFTDALNCRTAVAEFTRILEELSHSSERNLNPISETNAKLVYKKVVRTATDPFKRSGLMQL